jgi:Domain of unknown function (DUF4397)
MLTKIKNPFFLYIFSATIFCGCVKKDPTSTIAQVLFVPLSPNATAVDFSINGNVVATVVNYSTTVGTVRYTLPYYTIEPPASASTIAYNNNGYSSAKASITKVLLDESVYSTFLIDSAVKIKAVIVNDDLSDPTPGKVKIRFFHFSPNSVPLDVITQGTTNKLFANRSFNDQSANSDFEKFIEIDPGTYTFLFNNATTGATMYTTTAQVLLTDRIYTLAARGFTGGVSNLALGAWVYPNKP